MDKKARHFFIRDYDGNLIELIDSQNKFFNPQEAASYYFGSNVLY